MPSITRPKGNTMVAAGPGGSVEVAVKNETASPISVVVTIANGTNSYTGTPNPGIVPAGQESNFSVAVGASATDYTVSATVDGVPGPAESPVNITVSGPGGPGSLPPPQKA